jgi:hypothetical protein
VTAAVAMGLAAIFAALAAAAMGESRSAEDEIERCAIAALVLLGVTVACWAALTRPSWAVWTGGGW